MKIEEKIATTIVARVLLLVVLNIIAMGGVCQSVVPACRSVFEKSPSGNRFNDVREERILYVPVIFHIVYANENENIPDEQILEQLQVINRDFRRRNSDTTETPDVFKTVAADVRIEFYLAEDNPAKAITRTVTSHGPFGNDDLFFLSKGGKDIVTPDRFMNVWVANLGSGTLGFAASPGDPAHKDGIAIHYEYFGYEGNAVAPYNLGRTLTHEIGHWLGLQHPWGTGGCTDDDGFIDTPQQEGPSSNCDLQMTSCGNLNMIQNFMNTSFDACMNLFTKEQAEYMREVLITKRAAAYTTERIVTAVEEENPLMIAVFPNPVITHSLIRIRMANRSHASVVMKINDVHGRNVYSETVNGREEEVTINTEGWGNGLYIASLSNKNKTIYSKFYLNL